jgi:uncharacterized protein
LVPLRDDVRSPANRIACIQTATPQWKLRQIVIVLVVFVPFPNWFTQWPLRADFLWAAQCLCGAV